MANNIKFWDNQAQKYSTSENKEISEMVHKSLAYFNSYDTVLDYGCATGHSTIHIAPYVEHITGLDISSEMIKYAKERVQEEQVHNVTLIQGTHQQLNEIQSFDLIVAFNILHLFLNLENELNDLKQHLKPGGRLIANIPCLGENRGLLGKIIRLISKTGFIPKVQSYKIEDVLKTLKSVGFDINETEVSTHEVPNLFIVATLEA